MEIIGQLEKIVKEENIDLDKEVLFALAKSCDGSLRDAESMLDQLVSFSKDKVSLKDVISVLGIVEQEVLFEITDRIIEKDAKGALEILNRIIDQGKDIAVLSNNLIEHFRNLMIAKITKADAQLIDLPQEICERLLQQAGGLSLEEIFGAFNVLVNTQAMSKRLESLRIPLEISLVKLAHDKRSLSPKPTLPKENKDINPGAPIKEGPGDSGPLDNIKGAWQNIITDLARTKMSTATYLNEGSPVRLENNILTVSFPANYSLYKESLERKENKAFIENILSQIFNANLRVNFTLSKEVVHKEDEKTSPFIQSTLQVFKGRVIKEE
jgi:DNA polymerase-3 subunit gamma/tau